jgi:hypothetical protein
MIFKLMTALGLLALVAGIALVYIPAALIALGAVLLYLGLFVDDGKP